MIYFLKDYYNLVSKKLIMLAINKSNERIIQPFYVLIFLLITFISFTFETKNLRELIQKMCPFSRMKGIL